MTTQHRFTGSCHCGNLELAFETPTTPGELVLRSCQCSFCRRHGTRNVTDPAGLVDIAIADPSRLLRYRFGLKTADFLVCTACGVYVAAVYAEGDKTYATVNTNTFDDPAGLPEVSGSVDYDAESEAERKSRRAARWTPVRRIAEGAATTD
ncbi:MAG: aldehyde-activating protein [Alphaproteobacteria bacterium]|nr:aldehyde-activating protein [Alphaproteobacteria bacterium]